VAGNPGWEGAGADGSAGGVPPRPAATRRQGVTLFAVTLALVVAIGLAVFALQQRSDAIDRRNEATRQRDTARSRELAASVNLQLGVDPELSLLLATEAARVASTQQSEAALRLALANSQARAVLRGYDGGVSRAVFSSDGRLVASGGGDEAARLWDASTGRQLQVLKGHGESFRKSRSARTESCW
jgi:hypothetical protein